MTIDRKLSIDSDAFFDDRLGTAGVSRTAVAALAPRLGALRLRLEAWRRGDEASYFGLPFAAQEKEFARRARELSGRFARSVVFGIGGSSLGGEMLVRILGGRRHPVTFYDNVDPTTLAELEQIDWRETLLIVISKSGTTAETLAQLLTVLPALESSLGANRLKQNLLAVTESPDGDLARIAKSLGCEVLPHPAVGGRYSVLSVVGLLPAALSGVDIEALLAGARDMATRCLDPNLEANPALYQAAAQYLHAERGRTLCVQLSYADRLRPITRWYRQLLAESVGKIDRSGTAKGLTPIDAHGTTDQHSQLQLYLEGPDDKQFTLLCDPSLATQGLPIDTRFADLPAVAPLVNHTTGELFHAEFRATRETLTRRHRPNRTLTLGANAAALGELIILLETETVALSELLGVDAFNQPAVEEGKQLTREYLRQG